MKLLIKSNTSYFLMLMPVARTHLSEVSRRCEGQGGREEATLREGDALGEDPPEGGLRRYEGQGGREEAALR